jgi:hypothetical protein
MWSSSMQTTSLRHHLSQLRKHAAEARLLWFVARIAMKQKLSPRLFLPVLKSVHLGIARARAIAVLLPVYRQEVFERYLDHIGALITGRAFVFSAGGMRVSPDEQFMREIERDTEISPASSDRFRLEVMAAVQAFMAERYPSKAPHTVHEPLNRGIDRYLHRHLVNPHVAGPNLPPRRS